jgi:hypothetical protein
VFATFSISFCLLNALILIFIALFDLFEVAYIGESTVFFGYFFFIAANDISDGGDASGEGIYFIGDGEFKSFLNLTLEFLDFFLIQPFPFSISFLMV